jgi:hypothetical protein
MRLLPKPIIIPNAFRGQQVFLFTPNSNPNSIHSELQLVFSAVHSPKGYLTRLFGRFFSLDTQALDKISIASSYSLPIFKAIGN